MKTFHQLIIIGNGFDVACGLDSQFYKFFEPRINAIKRINDADIHKRMKLLREQGFTAWDLIFLYRKSLVDRGLRISWSDVEAAISEVVQMPSVEGAYVHSEVVPDEEAITVYSIAEYFGFIKYFNGEESPNQFLKDFKERVDNDLVSLDAEFELVFEGKESRDRIVRACQNLIQEDDRIHPEFSDYFGKIYQRCPNESSEAVARYLKHCFPDISSWNEDEIRRVLLEELHRLEEAFRTYISEEVKSKTEYPPLAKQLLKSIIEFDTKEPISRMPETTILNFNYTKPPVPGTVLLDAPQMINVHGVLEEELIFGTDGTNCVANAGALRFTKTYRLLELKRSELHNPVAFAPCDDAGLNETIAIKFYGHSLARADYSYFQSIFDIVDLYSGRVKLYFFYKEFKSTAREDLLIKISNLLDAYGTTMDNRDHGKNLMHRLLLEGRLVVHRI